MSVAETDTLNYETVARLSKGFPYVLHEIQKIQPALPEVCIEARDASVTVQVPIVDTGIDNIAKHFWSQITCKKPKTKDFHQLDTVNLTIKPGSLTLVLAPPGHGRSSLLKMLAGQLEPTSGSLRWNGLTQIEGQEEQYRMRVEKLCQYVDQVDIHLPLLTVRETFQFCMDHAFNPEAYNDPRLAFVHKHKVDMVLRQLGLEECADTIVGNEMIRGVSGGQRKRVTMGEVLCSDARALFLDEVTNGLDASTAYDVFNAMRAWTSITRGSCVAALLQPGPELFDLFDDLILLKDGAVVYSGPRDGVMAHFEQMGLYCPPNQEFADFLVEYLSHPKDVYRRQLEKQLRPTSQAHPSAKTQKWSFDVSAGEMKSSEPDQQSNSNTTNTKRVSISTEPEAVTFHNVEVSDNDSEEGQDRLEGKKAPVLVSLGGDMEMVPLGASKSQPSSNTVPMTAPEMVAALRASPVWIPQQKSIDTPCPKFDLTKYHPLVQRQYGGGFSHSFLAHFKVNFRRQMMMTARDKAAFIPRLFQATFMGVVLGTLFLDLESTEFSTRVSLIIFCMTSLAFSSMVELPQTMMGKRNVIKHYSYRLYPIGSQIMSGVISSLPITFAETLLFATLVYWLTDFASNAGRFVIFIITILAVNMAMSVFFRSLAYLADREEEAEAMSGPSVSVFMLFGGFLIARPKIPDWFIWLYWLSPFSWAGRGCTINEFHDARYDEINEDEGKRIGAVYLDVWGMYDNSHYVWLGIVFQIVFFVTFAFISAMVLKYRRSELSRGTKRESEDDEEAAKLALSPSSASSHRASVDLKQANDVASALPFEPVTLAFKDLSFIVGEIGTENEKCLLRNINGFALPGTLTALMGASGAGKTTLMDVLAGRKTQGKIDGQILINGQPKNDHTFNRIAGYVEQQDQHFATSTVYEALMFSATLRLPASVTDEQRRAMVDNVCDLLELTEIKHRMIGGLGVPGISPGQLKRVTMGVELAANPSVLFLDEPTSGLDSRTALSIVRVIRKVARTGRAVVCTIHQPSAEVFYYFDRLLLLQSGGFPVYFGDLGQGAAKLESYLRAIPGVPAREPDNNPAAWMLDCIGAGTSLGKQAKAESDESAQAQEPLQAVAVVADDANSHVHNHSRNKIDRFNEVYKASELYRANALTLEEACKPGKVLTENGYARSFLVQYVAVQRRTFEAYWRNIAFNYTRFFMMVFLSLLFGFIWFRIDDTDMVGLSSKMSSMFMTVAFCAILSCAPQMHVIFQARPTFYRERASRTYSSFAYSTSMGVAEVPYLLVASLLFVIPFYFLVDMEHDAGGFFRYFLAHFMFGLVLSYLSQILASVFPNVVVAQVFFGVVLTFLFLFAGIFIPGPQQPDHWRWVFEVNPMRYALQMMYITQFSCEGPTCPIIEVVSGTKTEYLTARQMLEKNYGVDFEGYWWVGFGFLAIYLCIERVLIALAVQFISHVKR